MPSQKAKRADDRRLAKPGKKKRETFRISPRMQKFMDGEIKIEDLDDEEIARGQIRADDGTFRGRPQDLVPRKFYEAAVTENIRRAQRRFQEELEPSIQVLAEIRDSVRAPADARYKSAVYLVERAAGKVPEKNEIKVDLAPWEANISGVLIDGDEEEDEDEQPAE